MQIYDEMRQDDSVRRHYARFSRWLAMQSPETIARKRPTSVDELAQADDLRRWQVDVMGKELLAALAAG